jgi:drug/metabolite transporter (DMT)-like permease
MTNEKKGEIFMVTNALFESWFPIIVLFTYSYLTPIFTYSFNIGIASIFFIILIIARKKFYEFKNKEAYKDLLLTTFFITLLFLLMFLGLQYTTATNTAVIIFMQLFFSFLYFNLIGKEYISKKHILGATMMATGAIIILFPDDLILNKGDLLVLIAAMIAPFANYYQKRARKYLCVENILAFRYMASLPFLLFFAYMFEPIPMSSNILNALPYLLISGLLVFGIAKIFWIEAIYRIPITKASALAAFMPVFTMFFAFLLLNEVPTLEQVLAIVPIVIGGYLITRKQMPMA